LQSIIRTIVKKKTAKSPLLLAAVFLSTATSVAGDFNEFTQVARSARPMMH
jgi:hypothetical protein